jgi:hypothetical protein
MLFVALKEARGTHKENVAHLKQSRGMLRSQSMAFRVWSVLRLRSLACVNVSQRSVSDLPLEGWCVGSIFIEETGDEGLEQSCTGATW